jgi:hypothetical protein
MYVERIPNRNSPPTILLRESYRDGTKTKKCTLANLWDWPAAKIEGLRRVLRREALAGAGAGELTLVRSLPHGHVAAVLGTLRKLGLDGVLAQGGRQPARAVALCIAMVTARVIDPASKLATARVLDPEQRALRWARCWNWAGLMSGSALDWLITQQERIEAALARRHLKNGMLVLYDVTSTYFEGATTSPTPQSTWRPRQRSVVAQVVVRRRSVAECQSRNATFFWPNRVISTNYHAARNLSP